jgi:hypothetical protein
VVRHRLADKLTALYGLLALLLFRLTCSASGARRISWRASAGRLVV